MAAYFNLNNNEKSKELLVTNFKIILDNQDRLMLNEQKIPLPNEPQRSPGFVQKQSPEVFCKKKCSLKVRKFHRKTSVLESLFNKVAGLPSCNFIKKWLQQWCFPVKFPKLLRTSILKNICERLLLFFSPQNTIANSSGKFGLDETLAECKVSIFLKKQLYSIKCSHIIYI